MLQRQQPEIEHLQRLVARCQRVVVALDQAPLVDVAVRIQQIAHRLRQRAAAAGVGPCGLMPSTLKRSSAERPSTLKISTL